MDGVCADFHSRARDLIEELFGRRHEVHDFKTWDVTEILQSQAEKDLCNSGIARPGFASSIKPFDHALEDIPELMEKYDVWFVTTPHDESKTWMQERKEWLMKHFNAKYHQIAHIHSKELVGVDVLVDDKPFNVSIWQDNHPYGHGFLMDAPYNRNLKDFHPHKISRLSDIPYILGVDYPLIGIKP